MAKPPCGKKSLGADDARKRGRGAADRKPAGEAPPAKKRGVSGRGAKQKGDRFERQCVELFRTHGIHAERVPLSGAVKSATGAFDGDIHVTFAGSKRKFECKHRARAWKDLYGWLTGNYALIIRRDHDAPLVVMPLSDFVHLTEQEEL